MKSKILEKITNTEGLMLQQIARDLVFEPFEGKKELDSVKAAMQTLETGVEKAKQGVSWTKKSVLKVGSWLEKTETSDKVKKYFKNKGAGQISSFFNKANEATSDIQQNLKTGCSVLEEKIKIASIEYLKKAFEMILKSDSEKWITERIPVVLNRNDIKTLKQVRELSSEDRALLISKLYPHDYSFLQKYSKSFDLTINITLGAIVATNLPFTGVAVSMINMIKTIVKVATRLSVMSAIYGYQIVSVNEIFKASSNILNSMQDWEQNSDHVPVAADFLAKLYSEENQIDEDDSFKILIEATLKKEAYIAIPGVGTVSLGKIHLDDYRLDILVKNQVENYFNQKKLVAEYGIEKIERELELYRLIYSYFKKAGYFKLMRKQLEEIELDHSEQKWKKRLEMMVGLDQILENSSIDLNHFAGKIFQRIKDMDQKQQEDIIKEEIDCILGI